MNRLLTLIALVSLLCLSQLQAQLLTRTFEIKDPSALERGFGAVVAGVDFDKDGKPEIYAVNTNMVDGDYEVIPRIYKFEWNPATASWDSVWGAVAPVEKQNTWPTLNWADIDNDNKPELYWAIVNNFTGVTNLNPARIVVYEYPNDGTNNMGVSDGFGGFLPNAQTSIVTTNSFNLRAVSTVISDIDNDTKKEIIFADRGASTGATGWHVGVLSVSDIPDFGSGLETWTTEFSGAGDIYLTGSGNKWDMAVINNFIYLFDGNLTDGSKVWPVKYSGGVWESLPGQSGIAGGNSSFKGVQVVDLNNDGTKEAVVAEWLGNAVGQGAKVWLLRQSGDTLLSTQIADLESLGAVRLNGSGSGDIDNDGKLDFVFGSRYEANNTRKVPIFRVEYQGGDITNPANYVSSVIDSAYWDKNGDMDMIHVANLDGDPAKEVIYTQGYSRGNANDDPMPMIVLDIQFTPVSVEQESDLVPAQFFLVQNYPNPFNPSTEIKFGITEAANVDLRIYDALGGEVAVLISNEFMSAGSYNVKFDASNLASGTYVYRMTAGANTVSRKMQLLK